MVGPEKILLEIRRVKALSVKHPWAEWIASGAKTMETRAWKTSHRGPLLICSSKELDKAAAVHTPETRGWVYGHAIAAVEMIDCRPMVEDDVCFAKTVLWEGAFVWVFAEGKTMRLLDPLPVRGQLGLFEVGVDLGDLEFEL